MYIGQTREFSITTSQPVPSTIETTWYVDASPVETGISIEIFDASGARVRVLDQGVREAGSYRAEWDGRDAANRTVGSGVYFYRLSGVRGAEQARRVL